MLINLPGLLLMIILVVLAKSVPQTYSPSNKHITTGITIFILGVFDIATSPFTTSTVSTLYTVPFAGYTRSSNNFKVGFSLNSIDIKFNNLTL
jgi:hypothetical protein